MRLEIIIENLSDIPLSVAAPLILGTLDFSSKNVDARYQDVAVATKEKTGHVSPKKDLKVADVNFLAMRERYFCAIIEPEQNLLDGYIKKTGKHDSEIGLSLRSVLISPGHELKETFRIYLGPQELSIIQKLNPAWASVVHYGTFDFISQILLKLLQFFTAWSIIGAGLSFCLASPCTLCFSP